MRERVGHGSRIAAGDASRHPQSLFPTRDEGSNPSFPLQIMNDLEKKNKALEDENKKLRRIAIIEQQNRRKLERRLRINKRETQRLTLENQQLRRQI
jgi:hypothetical protein